MLHEFLSLNRGDLIGRCRAKVVKRASPEASGAELDHGIPLFLDQLIRTLRVEQTATPSDGLTVSGPPGGEPSAHSEMGAFAAKHGGELMRRGFTVQQVVHDYGDLCQSITDLAFERNEYLQVDEFRTLNRCLDNAIAMAVTEFNYQRDFVVADQQAQTANMQIGFFAHELRNYLNTATLAIFAIKDGNLTLGGATGTVLERSLVGMRALIDRSLTEVRITAGLPLRHELFALADFISELKLSSGLEALVRKCQLTVSFVDDNLAVDADRDLLLAAVGNLLQNAFKFTKPGTEVLLRAFSVGNRIQIEVEDHGPGLPPGDLEKIFRPFTQTGTDRGGLGLGLSIARRSVEVNAGTLSARNKPDSGCVFSIDLPRHAMPRPEQL